jgi:hypothetical protein
MGTIRTLTKTTAATIVWTLATTKGGADRLAEVLEAQESGWLYDRQNQKLSESWANGKQSGYEVVDTGITKCSEYADTAVDAIKEMFSDEQKPKPTHGYGNFGRS